jgi:hypothetical protein
VGLVMSGMSAMSTSLREWTVTELMARVPPVAQELVGEHVGVLFELQVAIVDEHVHDIAELLRVASGREGVIV